MAKRRRQLKNIQVDELSIVDRPAVPKSKFVIAKRRTEEFPLDEEFEDSTEHEAVLAKKRENVGAAVAKAIEILRGVAAEMDPPGLHMLSQMMQFGAGLYNDLPEMKKVLQKCGDGEEGVEIRPVTFDAGVLHDTFEELGGKLDDLGERLELVEFRLEKAGDGESESEKEDEERESSEGLMDRVRKRLLAKKAAAGDERAREAIERAAGRIGELLTRVTSLEKNLSRACGKHVEESDD